MVRPRTAKHWAAPPVEQVVEARVADPIGRTRDTDRYVVVPSGGKSRSVRPARGGAFLFVFDGSLLPDEGIPRLGPKIQP